MEQGTALDLATVQALIPVISRAVDGTSDEMPLQERARIALDALPDTVVAAVRGQARGLVDLADARLGKGAHGE